MKILLIGSGGREDALAWAVRRSPACGQFVCCPGNAGIANRAQRLDIGAEDIDGLVRHARAERYDLVIVGPEGPLVAGLGDRLREADLAVFGPSAAAAQIEGSKVFSKRFLERQGIPTARFEVCSDLQSARAYLDAPGTDYPLVVKADGLAAGKGVIICDDRDSAVEAAESMLARNKFGSAGSRVLIEEMLRGREVSIFVLTDGHSFVELETCQDYKRALDGDEGLNTGGMGAYSPSVYLDDETRAAIMETVVQPTIDGLAAEERPYHGVLYIGLMLTDAGPMVLEYNARFGDPETQVLLPRLNGDWLPVLHACATGSLDRHTLRWRSQAAVCVVMSSAGYPGSYEKGRPIEGIERVAALDGVEVFHAGTESDGSSGYRTSGGRVLAVTALGDDLAAARSLAYEGIGGPRWPGAHYRPDIAEDAIVELARRTK